MAIFSQDRRAPIDRTLSIPARLDDELKSFAEEHEGSDVDYIILEIVRHHFEQSKNRRTTSENGNGKRPKENGKKAK